MTTGIPAPLHLMRAGLRMLPAPALRLVLRRISASLPRNHPDLVRRLVRVAPGRYLFEPTDLAQRFLLCIGDGGVILTLAAPGEAADAAMRGKLAMLIDLLEGRLDSDTALFARDIIIVGDMNRAVAFRNILDGETINLVGDFLARFGPLAPPLGRAAARLHRRVDAARRRLVGVRDRVHRAAHHGHDPNEDLARTGAQIDDLRHRVGQLERRVRRAPETT